MSSVRVFRIACDVARLRPYNQFWKFVGLVETDSETPRWLAIVFDHIYTMPSELSNVGKYDAFRFVFADALGVGHRPALVDG
jgi:hypothetical protein